MRAIKRISTVLATGAVAMGLLLSAPSAQAATAEVQPPGDTNATGIANLMVNGTLYDVLFVREKGSILYSSGFDFTTQTDAEDAREAVVNALNVSSAVTAGPAGWSNSDRAEKAWRPCSLRLNLLGAG